MYGRKTRNVRTRDSTTQTYDGVGQGVSWRRSATNKLHNVCHVASQCELISAKSISVQTDPMVS